MVSTASPHTPAHPTIAPSAPTLMDGPAASAAIPPVGTPVWGPDGAIGTLAGARTPAAGNAADGGPFLLVRLSHLLGLRHSTHVVPATWVQLEGVSPAGWSQISHPGRLRLTADRAQVAGCPRVRPDAHIRQDVARALVEARLTRGGATVHASVFDGVVELSGHTPGEDGMSIARERALEVPGVIAVVDRTTGQEVQRV